MVLDDPPAYGQADARAFVHVAGVQPLEDAENPLGVLLVETDAVVLDRDAALLLGQRSARLPLLARQDVAGLDLARPAARPARWNFRALPIRFCSNWRICSGSAWIVGSLPTSTRPWTRSICASRSPTTCADDLAQIDLHEIAGAGVVTRESVSRPSISSCIRAAALCMRLTHSWRRFVEQVLALHFQAVAEGADLAQRLLQVVRGHVGELLQVAVGPLQLGRVAGLLLFGLLAAR